MKKRFPFLANEYFWLSLILFLAAFLRLFKISSYMTFLGDEGRDAIALWQMVFNHKFRLIGPVTSIGNMYLGPLYYYLVLPAYFLAQSPIGPSVFVALLAVATVFLIWRVAREWFGDVAGLVASFLYAVSPVAIIYSRSSWNPNVMPFFSLLTIWGLWQIWQKKKYFWLSIIGVSLSFAAQSHYLGLLLLPSTGIFWLISLLKIRKDKSKPKAFWLFSGSAILIFLILTVLPLVWFDLRHDFINLNAFKAFFTVRQATVNIKIYKGFTVIPALCESVVTRLLAGKNEVLGRWLSIVVFVGLIIKLFLGVRKFSWSGFWERNKALALVGTWFLVGLLGLANYKQHIYDHYYGLFFPAPFLLIGLLANDFWKNKANGSRIILIFGIGILIIFSSLESPFRYPPNRQLQRTEKIAKFIAEKSNDAPFNLALIAKNNYDDAYAYFLEDWGVALTRIEPLRANETITGQLFVICEELPCQPINHPKAEIAMFGWAKVDQKWNVEGVEVSRLIHNTQ